MTQITYSIRDQIAMLPDDEAAAFLLSLSPVDQKAFLNDDWSFTPQTGSGSELGQALVYLAVDCREAHGEEQGCWQGPFPRVSTTVDSVALALASSATGTLRRS